MEKCSVYVQTDGNDNIVSVNSNVFQGDLTGWTKIDEGIGVKFLHAQGNYFPKPIRTEGGVYRYKLVDGSVHELAGEEIDRLEAAIMVSAAPTKMDRIEAQVAYTAMMTDTLLEV